MTLTTLPKSKTRRALITALIGAAAVLPMHAGAKNADAGLYAAAPPPNSVFVRVVSIVADGQPLNAYVGKTSYAVPAGSATAYKVVPAGQAQIKLDSHGRTVSLTDGRYYTVVISGPRNQPRAQLMEDPKLDSKVKGLIAFYNLTGRSALSLKTADGSAAVVDAVAPGTVGSRPVNSATTGFAVFDGASQIGQVPQQTIERGNAYSSIVTEIGGKLKVVWVRSETTN
ncbi:alginate O-acetyltransferase AlgF [Asticcacaulis sp. AC460]|uniref:alginate O-acetyltransferase AlgF n=1 Tax=Asticcacaulis sp. AC460 TaxID=1282360 RepID=UPI00138AD3C7|nr:alginate O-acetyltransferase AlgF [Asticcacaulis sp. AC460]